MRKVAKLLQQSFRQGFDVAPRDCPKQYKLQKLVVSQDDGASTIKSLTTSGAMPIVMLLLNLVRTPF